MQRFTIRSTGKFLPGPAITSSEMDRRSHVRAGSCFKKSGVQERHHATRDSLSSMAVHACHQALDQAALNIADIDLIISASVSRERILPCTAAHIQQALGDQARGIPCFDVDSSCISFLTALDVSLSFLAANRYQRILIVSSEKSHLHLSSKNTKTFALFGDGAAACIIESPHHASGITHLASHFETHTENLLECQIHGGASVLPAMAYNQDNHDAFLFQMNGSRLFKSTVKHITHFLDTLLAKANRERHHIDWLIPHQASGAALKLMPRHLHLKNAKTINILPNHGNQIAASIPTALHEALQQNLIQPGQTALLIGTGAGLGLGAILLQF